MKFGVHVSIAGGLAKAVARAEELGCDCFQIFAGNPRGWARKPMSDSEAESFRRARAAKGLGPVVVHLAYLPNPASADPALYGRSILTLREDFARANRIGADYFVLHPGTCPPEGKEEAMARVAEGLEQILKQVPGRTMMLLENQSSRRRDIGADLADLAALARALDDPRVGICLDTCHAFAAGYDLRNEAGWQEVLTIIADGIGLDRLGVIHANDAQGALGSGIDRHAHIGQGHLGAAAFTAMGRIGSLADRAVILETPQDDPADDPRNLAAIRLLTAGGS